MYKNLCVFRTLWCPQIKEETTTSTINSVLFLYWIANHKMFARSVNTVVIRSLAINVKQVRPANGNNSAKVCELWRFRLLLAPFDITVSFSCVQIYAWSYFICSYYDSHCKRKLSIVIHSCNSPLHTSGSPTTFCTNQYPIQLSERNTS